MDIIKLIIILIVLLIALIFIEYNSLIKLKQRVNRSKSLIDVYCKERFDLIPNLVSVIKGYTTYEKETYEEVIKLRSQYNETRDISLGSKLESRLNTLIALVESNPNLKANEQFLYLQKTLTKMENQLQAARRIYNIDVTDYNNRIETLPHNIYAKLFGFKKENWFQITNETERDSINIDNIN